MAPYPTSKRTLEGVRAKIDRARDSLRSLESDIASFCEDERRKLLFEVDQRLPNRSLDAAPEALVGYSIRVGEIAYNLRSALDHLVWQLVIANNEKPCSRNEFPIFKEEATYKDNVVKKLRGVSSFLRELIEAVQPYQKDGGLGSHLWMLHSICNIDKHRYLNIANLHTYANAHLEGEVPPSLVPRGMTGGLGLLGILKGTEHEAKIKFDIIVDVCFRDDELEEASPGYDSELEREGIKRPPVRAALSACLMAVDTVVERIASPQGTT